MWNLYQGMSSWKRQTNIPTEKICPFTQITVNIKKHGIMLKSMAADNLGALDY